MSERSGAVVPGEARAQVPVDTVLEDAPESWPVESSTEVFRNWLISVRNDEVRMPGDRVAERSVVTHPGAVSVLALDDAGRALMIRQYRHPVGRLLWELPAGLLDHPGESLVDAAKRELLEETGYRATTWHTLIDHYSSPGFTNERVRIFLARGLEPAADGGDGSGYVRQDEEALIVTRWLPLRDVVPAILAGKLHNGHTIAGLLAAHAASPGGFTALRPADAPY
jgi:8-oxo-dGDP phosphatase